MHGAPIYLRWYFRVPRNLCNYLWNLKILTSTENIREEIRKYKQFKNVSASWEHTKNVLNFEIQFLKNSSDDWNANRDVSFCESFEKGVPYRHTKEIWPKPKSAKWYFWAPNVLSCSGAFWTPILGFFWAGPCT